MIINTDQHQGDVNAEFIGKNSLNYYTIIIIIIILNKIKKDILITNTYY